MGDEGPRAHHYRKEQVSTADGSKATLHTQSGMKPGESSQVSSHPGKCFQGVNSRVSIVYPAFKAHLKASSPRKPSVSARNEPLQQPLLM